MEGELSTFILKIADIFLQGAQTVGMFRTIFLCFCLLLAGCTAAAEVPHPDPTVAATASPAPSPKPDWAGLIDRRTVSLRMPGRTESVPLSALGFFTDGEAILLDRDALMRYVNAFTAAYRTEPTPASAALSENFENPFVYTAGEDGSEPDRNALFDLLAGLDPKKQELSVSVPFDPIAPEVTEETLRETHALLAEYTTSFAEKSLKKANRVHNIKLAAERIHGVVVEPGAVFSMNKTIGDRTKGNGYLLAGAIANGTSTTEYGGGVCQVSTTLFNAVLMADLEVVERYHHSWPMQYAPVGRDATISTGIKDFRFRNTTDAPVTITASVDEQAHTVTVRLYGRHSADFAYIEIVSEQIKRLPGKEGERILDESLPPGTKEVERQGRRGRVAVVYRDFYAADGSLLRRETAYEDTYPSIGEIVYLSSDLYYGTDE